MEICGPQRTNPNDFGESVSWWRWRKSFVVSSFEWSVSTAIVWIDMKFGLWTNYINLNDLLTFQKNNAIPIDLRCTLF